MSSRAIDVRRYGGGGTVDSLACSIVLIIARRTDRRPAGWRLMDMFYSDERSPSSDHPILRARGTTKQISCTARTAVVLSCHSAAQKPARNSKKRRPVGRIAVLFARPSASHISNVIKQYAFSPRLALLLGVKMKTRRKCGLHRVCNIFSYE